MKFPLLAILFTTIAAAADEPAFAARALLVSENGASREIRLLSATKDTFLYQEMEGAGKTVGARMPQDGTVFLLEPREFTEAMDLYQAHKYQDARLAFIRVKERFKPVGLLENSPAALAAFYEMECLRKTGDLEGLASALQQFTRNTITRETLLSQIELYVLWDAVRTKSWERLETLATERLSTRLPGDRRAQVAMCHGLALEGLNRPHEALPSYQTALTADSGTSEEIARQAALRILAIHHANPQVKNALKHWGTSDEDKNSMGYRNLLEAAAVASMFEMTLGAGTALPEEFLAFLKCRARPGTGG
jgi:tetratricopeptide (TPR) repeat protein